LKPDITCPLTEAGLKIFMRLNILAGYSMIIISMNETLKPTITNFHKINADG
jgi:hypothetical protein